MQKKNTSRSKKKAVSRETATPVIALMLAAFLIGAFLYDYVLPKEEEQNAVRQEYQVRISEVMSANVSAITSDTGKYSDWLEIVNDGEEAINLQGWTLTKVDDATSPLTFPDVTLQSDEYMVIFADGKAQTTAGYQLHAPWKLTAAGDSLILSDASGNQVDAVTTPSLEKNEVYARNDENGEWEVTRQYTPGMANTAESYSVVMQMRMTAQDAIEISEVMVKNCTYAPDEDGECGDYIELHNTSDRAVSLKGYSLSDTDANLTKWVLPDVRIEADGYLLIYASGKNRTGDYLHTGFKLSEGESVFLTNPDGQMVACVSPETTEADQAWSLTDDGFTAIFPPTPGQPNTNEGVAAIDAELTSSNIYNLYISEIMTSTSETDLSENSYDWVEIYNSSNGTIDLSGIALSDDANHPRKWQFPSGATIGAGEYKIVFMTGEDTTEDGDYCASFRLSKTGGYSLLLSTSSGEVIDRIPVGAQYANISYGRSYNLSGFRYYTDPTPRAANTTSGYEGRAAEAAFSAVGGIYEEGEIITLTLSAPEGSTIYYTTDCSDPDESSNIYTAPITISSTTIVRTIVQESGKLPSMVTTQSYLFGADHTMRVISLVSDPVNLFDYYEGIYEMGPGAVGDYAEYPYGSNNHGANFWMDWEKAANVELFDENGETMLSQGCGLKLQGQYSRAEDQKAFKLIARSEYGSNRFEAALFDDRPYTEYQSFILRASGQDGDKTRMRDIVQTSLAADTDVMYQAAEMCVVYLNGEYWGHYNMRERINKYSIAQWEDWSSDVDAMDLIKANRSVLQGSNETFEEIASWVEENGVHSQEAIDYVAQYVDIDNYLDYVAVQIYIGNPDLLNVKRYRSTEEDGKWRWVLFDTDWGFTTDTNSMRRWLDPRGAGSEYKTDNRLFVGLMGNEEIEEKFLRRFNELMVSSWTADKVLATIDEYYQELLPEIDQHLERWGIERSKFDSEMEYLINYAEERPLRMLYYIKSTYDFDDEEMTEYFAESLAIVVPAAVEDIASKLQTAGLNQYLDEWDMTEAEYNQNLEALRTYAQEKPVRLLDALYNVYGQPEDTAYRDLKQFKAVLKLAK